MSLQYPQILNLDKLKVYVESDSNNSTYFLVDDLPSVLTYGKHYFKLSYNFYFNYNYNLFEILLPNKIYIKY